MRCEHGFSGGSPLECGNRQDCVFFFRLYLRLCRSRLLCPAAIVSTALLSFIECPSVFDVCSYIAAMSSEANDAHQG